MADCGMMADRLMVRMVSMVGVACWMSTLRIVVLRRNCRLRGDHYFPIPADNTQLLSMARGV